MNKQDVKCSIESTTEEQVNSLVDSYNFERIEYVKMVSDFSINLGWLILAWYIVKIFHAWLMKND